MCGPNILRNGIQVRWLQTAGSYIRGKEGYLVRDLVTLEDVSIILQSGGTNVTLVNGTNSQFDFRNSEVPLSNVECIRPNEENIETFIANGAILLGALCNTSHCQLQPNEEHTVITSRIATTIPLNVSHLIPTPTDPTNVNPSVTPILTNVSPSVTPVFTDFSSSATPVFTDVNPSVIPIITNVSPSITFILTDGTSTSILTAVSPSVTPILTDMSPSVTSILTDGTSTSILSNVSPSVTPILTDMSPSVTSIFTDASPSVTPVFSDVSSSPILTSASPSVTPVLTEISTEISSTMTPTATHQTTVMTLNSTPTYQTTVSPTSLKPDIIQIYEQMAMENLAITFTNLLNIVRS